jgi:cobalt-zinc-cadmium efflux system outer membrane protein
VHCEVHAEFHRALVERERVQLARRVVGFQEEVLRTVERQIAAGETAPLSLRLAQAEVAQARQQLALVEQALLASRIRLAQLAGYPSSAPPDPSGVLDTPREPPELAALLATAHEKLPSLRAAAAKLREAEARREAAESAAGLKPTLGVQYSHEGRVAGAPAENVLQGVLALPIPSFDTNRGERATAGADVTVAEAELAAANALLEGEIAAARSEVVAAARRTFAYGREILPRFEEDLALLRRSFELGEIDLLALSAGRERFLRIQSDALVAQLDYFVALAELERVVGVDLWHDDHAEGK